MSKRIQVTGIVVIEDDEYDPGPDGPLTEEAYNDLSDQLALDDLRFEVAE